MQYIHAIKISGITKHLIASIEEDGITNDEFAAHQGEYVIYLARDVFDSWYMKADEFLTTYADAKPNPDAPIQTLFVEA